MRNDQPISISLIHPSRQRPLQAFKAYQQWKANRTSFEEIEYILVLDRDDPTLPDYINLFKNDHWKDFQDRYFVQPLTWTVEKINFGASKARGNILMFMADDLECTYGWDEEILCEVEGKEDFVLRIADGLQKWLCTHPVMDRAFFQRKGYFFHPDYQHMFCDQDLTCEAFLEGKLIKSDLRFKHNHPLRPANFDEVNKKAYTTMVEGRKIFEDRLNCNFGLRPEQIVNVLPDYMKR